MCMSGILNVWLFACHTHATINLTASRRHAHGVQHVPQMQQTYAAQHSYEDGSLACSSISLHWSLACVHAFIEPMCGIKQMEQLVRHSINVHKDVRSVVHEGMLKTTDITDRIGMPHNTTCLDVYMHTNSEIDIESASDFKITHARDIASLLHPDSALVLTYSRHTRAMYCDHTGKLFVFDSMPGLVLEIERAALAEYLFGVHTGAAKWPEFEAYGILITKRDANKVKQ